MFFKNDRNHFKNDRDRFKNDRDRFKNDRDRFKNDGDRFKNDGDHFKNDGDRFKNDGDRLNDDVIVWSTIQLKSRSVDFSLCLYIGKHTERKTFHYDKNIYSKCLYSSSLIVLLYAICCNFPFKII